MQNNNTYVYIGRFQIPHLGHEAVIEHAMKNCSTLIVLIGSANVARNSKNPFNYEERKEMLLGITEKMNQKLNTQVNIIILPLDDFNSDKLWTAEVTRLVSSYALNNVFITGCRKSGDESTFYLNLFPHWKADFIEEVNFTGIDVISSTKIRELFFKNLPIPAVISTETQRFLDSFKANKNDLYHQLSAV